MPDYSDPRVRWWCNPHRSTFTDFAKHVAEQHPDWTADEVLANSTVLDNTGNIPPAPIGVGTINDTAAVAVRASYISSSKAGRFGGLGYRARRIWPKGK